MLIDLDTMKEFLGITTDDYDDFLVAQEEIIAQSVEGYCGRKFLEASYVQTYYSEDYINNGEVKDIKTFHYPVSEITTIELEEEDISEDIRLHKETGNIHNKCGFFNGCDDEELIVSYTAGYADLPAPVASVVLSLVEERYNKKVNGVSLNFGSDVQSISIPGTISIAFDYSLQANERKTAYGTILGNYVNVLDAYRSERVIVGSGSLAYVEEE